MESVPAVFFSRTSLKAYMRIAASPAAKETLTLIDAEFKSSVLSLERRGLSMSCCVMTSLPGNMKSASRGESDQRAAPPSSLASPIRKASSEREINEDWNSSFRSDGTNKRMFRLYAFESIISSNVLSWGLDLVTSTGQGIKMIFAFRLMAVSTA